MIPVRENSVVQESWGAKGEASTPSLQHKTIRAARKESWRAPMASSWGWWVENAGKAPMFPTAYGVSAVVIGAVPWLAEALGDLFGYARSGRVARMSAAICGGKEPDIAALIRATGYRFSPVSCTMRRRPIM
jgi:hypothetical protein